MLPPPFPAAEIARSPLADHATALRAAFACGWQRVLSHGDAVRWQRALSHLPAIQPTAIHLDRPEVGVEAPLDAVDSERLRMALKALMPWRKGPFRIAGIAIDCEWRSDLKWERLRHAITPLAGRTVLDIGCGSGYHCWRMRGAGASLVIGIDPTALYAMQFRVLQHVIADPQVQMWPLGIDDMPDDMPCFDTLFSMGLLYHRRSPLDHLKQLQTLLRPGGELVLETLVVEGDGQTCLMPRGRYAKMRNVWFIPSVAMLTIWLTRCGWRDVRLIDCTITTPKEQRATEWMVFESLPDFLDPNDRTRTIEGYPAPMRALLIAQK